MMLPQVIHNYHVMAIKRIYFHSFYYSFKNLKFRFNNILKMLL